jgi:hypothetical protein
MVNAMLFTDGLLTMNQPGKPIQWPPNLVCSLVTPYFLLLASQPDLSA